MPKKFEYVGLRKYDPLASSEERKYTEGIDYYGGDTQVYLTDLSVPEPDRKPIRISCIHSLTGGRLFRDMLDTSCQGQLHKSYMPGRIDSDPIQITISAMASETMKIVFKAFRSTHTLQMMIVFPDSRYEDGLVRVESIDYNATNDTVFEYIVTFRRVFMPEIGEGVYTVEYDLRGGHWADEYTPPTSPYYTLGATVHVAMANKVVPPIPSYEFEKFTVYDRTTGEETAISSETFELKGNTIIQANYKRGEAELTLVVASPNDLKIATLVTGDISETKQKWPIGSVISLPQKPNVTSSNPRYELVGWTINGTHYEFGATYTIPAKKVVVEGYWKEMTFMTFAGGSNTNCKVPAQRKVGRGEYVTVPTLDEVTEYDPKYYNPIGWIDTDGNSYKPGGKLQLSSDITLNVKWQTLHRVVYTLGNDVTDVSPGSLPIDEQSYAVGAQVTMMPMTLTRPNHVFSSWGKDSSEYEANSHYIVKSNDDKDIVFEALWKEDT